MGRIGVCSWSLSSAPGAQNPSELAQAASACGVDGVQIALDPIRQGSQDAAVVASRMRDAGLTLLSGMMATRAEDYTTLDSIRRTGGLRPDEHWPANLDAARRNADLAARLGLKLVTMHAGFLPQVASGFRPMGGRTDSRAGGRPDTSSIAQKGDAAERAKLLDRLAQVARAFESRGVALGLETGQETAVTLLEVLAAPGLARVGVNFDPGNVILYGMGEPVEALRALAGRVVQLHIKDALPAPPDRAREWGAEVPVGQGAVNWPALLGVVREAGLDVDLVIEREAGDDRIGDVRKARTLIEGLRREAR
jgi:L-ribulose-5-phosphate 3-epimerase